jgi:hypothetical protein
MKIRDIIESKSKNRELWDRIKSKGVVPGIDRERYTDMSDQGLEGPFRMKNGQVLYYDPKEGKYYNRDTDMYVDYEEYRAMDEGYAAASKKAESSRQRAIKRAAAYKRHGDIELVKELELALKGQPMGESEKVNENHAPSGYQTYDVFGVNIPANVYDGKYYDYRTVKYTVFKGMDGVETEQDAVNWVNTHRDQVLADLAARRTQSGKLVIAKPAEKNVFFKDNYTVKPSQITRATDAPPKANFDPTAMTQTQPVDSKPTAQVSEDKALSMGGALKNALAKAEPGSKLDLSIKAHNNSIKNGGPPTMKNAPTGYHIDKKGYIRLGEQTQPSMNTYRVWGEYGPVAADRIEFKVQAKSPEDARKKAIQQLKKTAKWDRIGEHNVYVTMTESAKPKVVLQTMPNRIRGGSNDAYVVISSQHPNFEEGSTISKNDMRDPKNRMRWKSLKDELEFVILPHDKASDVAEGDKRPGYVVSTKDKPKKIKPTTGGSSDHPYQGKLVGEAEVNNTDYEWTHGRKPSGLGSWFFVAHRGGIDFGKHVEGKDYIKLHQMSYGDAKNAAIRWAREKGHHRIYVAT